MLTVKLRRFARRLQDEELSGEVTNFYRAKRTNLQRSNLQRYLAFMYEKGTDVLLVGEAPGYNGCRLTGVPFTSEYIIRRGVLDGKLFGVDNGYRASVKKVKKEQSATAMWSVLEEMEVLPLLWNAFPFHPYKKENIYSNRKPTVKELEIGKHYLSELIELFDIKVVIAVGNVADDVLNRMEIEHTKVRHPSYGGKKDFKEQLRYNLKKENL
jgi:uracil-DNA glycosylase